MKSTDFYITQVAEVSSTAGSEVLIIGQIDAGVLSIEPYAPIAPEAAIENYNILGRDLVAAGVQYLLVCGARSLLQARTALLGLRDCGLPVAIALELVEEGNTLLGGGDILSAFLTLQALGTAALGFSSDVTALQLDALALVAPYCQTALLSMSQNLADALSPEDNSPLLAQRADGLSTLGVSWLEVKGGQLHHMIAATGALYPSSIPSNLLDGELWTAEEDPVCYLDEHVELS